MEKYPHRNIFESGKNSLWIFLLNVMFVLRKTQEKLHKFELWIKFKTSFSHSRCLSSNVSMQLFSLLSFGARFQILPIKKFFFSIRGEISGKFQLFCRKSGFPSQAMKKSLNGLIYSANSTIAIETFFRRSF